MPHMKDSHHDVDADEHRLYPWDPIAGGYRLRKLDDGHVVWLVQRMFTWSLVVGQDGKLDYDKHWCWETPEAALRSALEWDGNHPETEPQGWFRDPYTGRRRPDGDPAREYVAL
jgi:hypothetical protein